MELGEGSNEDYELREMPTTSSSMSSYSGSSQASLETDERSHEACEHLSVKTNKAKSLWERLKEKASFGRMNKFEDTSSTQNRIWVDISPAQYLVNPDISPTQYLVNQKEQALKQVKKDTPKQSHKVNILHQSRAQLKRRLKLLTIAEDEEFDTELHEC